MVRKRLGWKRTVIAMVILSLSVMSPSFAETLQSSNYFFDESSIGTGGMLQSSSTNFQATSSTGDLAIGNSASANLQTNAGGQTSPDPALSFSVNSASADFGSFTPTTASVATASFSVSNYTTFGYVVQIVGPPPTNAGHALTPMATTTVSQPGIEQFGLNLVANTSPVSVGANLNNGQFGHGQIAPNYATPNEYRYVSGETIALAQKNSGITTYTMTYLANVAQLTPGGQYTTNQTLIVTGTY